MIRKMASIDQISNDTYSKLNKVAHRVWDVEKRDGEIIVNRKVDEISYKNYQASEIPNAGDKVEFFIGGNKKIATVLVVDDKTIYCTDFESIIDIPISWSRLAQTNPDELIPDESDDAAFNEQKIDSSVPTGAYKVDPSSLYKQQNNAEYISMIMDTAIRLKNEGKIPIEDLIVMVNHERDSARKELLHSIFSQVFGDKWEEADSRLSGRLIDNERAVGKNIEKAHQFRGKNIRLLDTNSTLRAQLDKFNGRMTVILDSRNPDSDRLQIMRTINDEDGETMFHVIRFSGGQPVDEMGTSDLMTITQSFNFSKPTFWPL